jgi:aminoglycoside phosphotransferase family enzyme/predicted kinase
VDFSSLEKRRFFCEEELRLNQILCPNLYIEVCAVFRHPRVGGDPEFVIDTFIPDSNIVDYAIKMKQFNQDALLSWLLAHADESNLDPRLRGDDKKLFLIDEKLTLMMDDIAKQLAYFHEKTTIAPPDSPYGNLLYISEPMLANFKTIEELRKTSKDLYDINFDDLKSFCLSELQRLSPLFLERKRSNFIRDCHGDLHLGNLFLDKSISEHVCIFDRIEFNLSFRFIDVINDLAFLFMDLKNQSLNAEAFRFLNVYLEITGDYEGLQILNFYAIYRALVRAKVALLIKNTNFNNNLQTALQLMQFQKLNKPILIMMHGISGGGKTYLAKQLAPHISAILIRSDVERKRLFFGINKKELNIALKDEHSLELYSDAVSKMTFDKLLQLAETIINSGYSVIVDATFLRVAHRKPFIELSKKLNCPYKILQCETSIEMIHQRVKERFILKQDASDADSRVVELQLLEYEEPTEAEKKQSISVNTMVQLNIKSIVKLLK